MSYPVTGGRQMVKLFCTKCAFCEQVPDDFWMVIGHWSLSCSLYGSDQSVGPTVDLPVAWLYWLLIGWEKVGFYTHLYTHYSL